MNSGPLITTERLELWRPVASDLAEIHAVSSDELTRRFLGPDNEEVADTFARLLRNAGSWDLYGYGIFMLRLRGDAHLAGMCGIFHSWRGFGQGMDDVPEAGWIVARRHWGQGLAAEAMHAILDWFDRVHGPRRVACMIEEGHDVSDHLAQRLGFRPYGRHRPGDDSTNLIFYERQSP